MKIITKVREMQEVSESIRREGKKIACVPTMGYLHEGHLSLVKKGKVLADVVITTNFVNPTQFAPNEDFEQYPRDLERDCKLLEEAGADYVFAPSAEEMYPGYNTEINIKGVSQKFEGLFRPIHFNGVASVVAKLFIATKPHYAIFGQKDYQQTLVVKQMVRDMLFETEIIIAPIIREEDGLARSSRNIYLSQEERQVATTLHNALLAAKTTIEAGVRNRDRINSVMKNYINETGAFKIDYASIADAETLEEPMDFKSGQKAVLLVAAYLGKTRLIDNELVVIK